MTDATRVPDIMKHACVAARIADAKTSNAASRGGRSRFQALHAWMRPRSATLGAPNPRDSCTPTRSHPRKRGASEGGRGFPLGSDPVDAHWDRRTSAHDRHHGRIPINGAPAPRCADPCSALRCAADSGCNPLGLARVLACSPRLSAKGFCCWGGDGGQVAHLNSVGYVAVPANGPAANESRRHFVASHLLRMIKPRALLRVLSQNRDSASRVSSC